MTACPTCGETDDLSGRPAADDIEVTCGACGTSWMRGDPRCKGCGATGGIPYRQVMTRTPRGNQVAVVGHREVVLCPTCDAEAISAAAAAPVPEHYVSVFLFGVPSPTAHAPRAPRAPAEDAPSPTNPPAPHRGPPPAATPAAPAPATAAEPAGPVDPTARQAIEAYLTATPEGDSLTMLMLGRHLGPSRRVRDLDGEAEQQRLRTWFDRTWSVKDQPRRDAARAALTDVLAHWRARGWVGPETLQRLD